MTPRKTGLVLAICAFGFWLLVLYAGADHPVPPGFVWVILLDAIAAWLVYFRVPTYLEWAASRRPYRLLRAAADGAATGLAFAAIALLIPGSGEPSIHPTLFDRLIWFAVLAAVGSVSTAFVYLFSAAASKLLRKG